jgi:hypothetical protein
MILSGLSMRLLLSGKAFLRRLYFGFSGFHLSFRLCSCVLGSAVLLDQSFMVV